MKNKIWVLIMMAGIIIGIIACDDKPKETYTPSNHLGIDETCPQSTECGLQDYRTAEQKAVFPKEINRYGKAKYYTDAELKKAVADIISIFNQIETASTPSYYDGIVAAIDKLCVVQSSGTNVLNTNYTWNKTLKILGVDPDATATDIDWLVGRLPRLNPGDGRGIDEVAPAGNLLTQLQPASNVRMAKGKKSTERFPVIAGGADKDPKVNTVAQNFRLNRHAIARNNRNVKSQLRQT